MRTIIILGSARKDGNTGRVAKELASGKEWDMINLNNYNFSYYDYSHKNMKDDFIPLLNYIIENYEVLIFATPVYWYSMSGIMKVFFDRLTDLITLEKELGRRMRGKKMAVLTTSNGSNLGDLFWQPFINTAEYLGMIYLGNIHTVNGQGYWEDLQVFMKLMA